MNLASISVFMAALVQCPRLVFPSLEQQVLRLAARFASVVVSVLSLSVDQAKILNEEFGGAKVALLYGDSILVYLRDDKPSIPFPNQWDLPGGGRENDESAFECVQREVFEEFGFSCCQEGVLWSKTYRSLRDDKLNHFFVAKLEIDQIKSIRFSDEGQEWRMMSVGQFLTRPDAVKHLQALLAAFCSDHEFSRD
jgi:8-oxo-dGTP diphosphatase